MQNYRKLTINLKKKCNYSFLKINNKINNNSHRNQNLRYYFARNARFNAFANNALKSMKNGDIN